MGVDASHRGVSVLGGLRGSQTSRQPRRRQRRSDGRPTLSAAIAEDKQTIEEVYEPYLLQSGFVNRTAQGRVATEKAYRHLGLVPPASAGDSSFALFEEK